MAKTWTGIKHFSPDEFKCRCGKCDSTGEEMDMLFIGRLDALRARLGFPLWITSGYRCPDHNERISSTGRDGPHTTGHAADVGISGQQAYMLVRAANQMGGFTGIGINQRGEHRKRFIHLDDLLAPDHPRPGLWTY